MLRGYQTKLVNAACAALDGGEPATLIVAATGTGKTQMFCSVAKRYLDRGRVIVIAHRQELIDQAARRLKAICGVVPVVEKADQFSDEECIHGKPPLVVASVQSLNSGSDDLRRLHRFTPDDFSLLVIDEAHHGVAASYRRVIDHFRQNADCRVLLVTATPDRADERGLKEICEHVAGVYDLPDAIADGYLVPVRQRRVRIDGLEFAKIHTLGDDFNQGELEAAMLAEKPLHGVCHATIEQSCGLEIGFLETIRDEGDRIERLAERLNGHLARKTLVFTVSVAHAERLAEIINRWIPDSAESVSGATPKDERAAILGRFAAGKTRFLCNCAIALEGFDEPSIALVSMARPTKSRTIYAQACGRATRPSDAIARELGMLEDAADRRQAIAVSDKPAAEILDFVGNSGRHKLVCTADLLGTADPREVIDRAAEIAEEETVDMQQALSRARDEAMLARAAQDAIEDMIAQQADEEDERRLSEAAARRLNVVATSSYYVHDVGAFDHSQVEAPSRHEDKATVKQVELLRKLGVDAATAASYSRKQAGAVITSLKEKRGTNGQRWKLQQLGYSRDEIEGMNFEQCSAAIGAAVHKGVA